jgi:hypothetical protein
MSSTSTVATAGRSTHFDTAPKPDLAAALAGDLSSASYTLSDMAADAVGLPNALGIATALVVGAPWEAHCPGDGYRASDDVQTGDMSVG